MNLKASLIHPQIVHVQFDNQYFLTSNFMRVQEFYESPFDNIKNCSFTMDEFMDEYVKNRGKFDYFTEWSGFNFPDIILKNFIATQKILYPKEKTLFKYIKCLVDWEKPFYVIGSYHTSTNEDPDDVLNHELAHAFYYLSPAYQNKMNKLLNSLSIKDMNSVLEYLKESGYDLSVCSDEVQAYLSTTCDPNFSFSIKNPKDPKKNVTKKISQKTIKQFSKVFESEKNKYL